MNQLVKKTQQLLTDEKGQTTLEWITLGIIIAMTIVVVGLALQNGFVEIIKAIVAKVISIVNAISL